MRLQSAEVCLSAVRGLGLLAPLSRYDIQQLSLILASVEYHAALVNIVDLYAMHTYIDHFYCMILNS